MLLSTDKRRQLETRETSPPQRFQPYKELGVSVPMTPDPDTFAKPMRYKWEVYVIHMGGVSTLLPTKRVGMSSQKSRDANVEIGRGVISKWVFSLKESIESLENVL